jgi:hypothetical protein
VSRNSYTAQQALDLLLTKLRAQNDLFATSVQAAIDAGKDVSEEEPATDRRKKPRVYRRTVRFTHEEALQVAFDALQAYFVEQPLFINDAADNFAKAALGRPTHAQVQWMPGGDEQEPVVLEQQGLEKQLEIELHTETQVTREGDEIFVLKRQSKQSIEAQRQQIQTLRALTDFSGE